MESSKEIIIVPWDFSDHSENALKHAIQLANVVGNNILLVNVVEKRGLFTSKSVKQKEIDIARMRLKETGNEISRKYNVEPFILIEEGFTSKNFENLITDANANLVLLGANLKVGKNVLGPSEYLNVLKETNIPFIVAEHNPSHTYYKEIVVPMDHDKTYRETVQWIVYLSKYYQCNINIIKPYLEEGDLKKDMENNIYFTKKMLDAKGVIYGIKTAKKNKSFRDEIFNFAEMIDADLIVMMAKNYKNYMIRGPKHESKTPVMCVNRRTDIIKYGGFR